MFIEWASFVPSLLLTGDSGWQFDRRADVPQSSFVLYQQASLDALGLGDSCTKALYTNITCPDYVRTFLQLRYRGSPGSKDLTDSICTTTCQASLKGWFTSVSAACAGKTLHDAVPQRLGGLLYEGWNETCVRDPKTKDYCNGKVAWALLIHRILALSNKKTEFRRRYRHVCRRGKHHADAS